MKLLQPGNNLLSHSYRECIKSNAFKACVSQRSVSASSSALNCSQVSLLGAPIKPTKEAICVASSMGISCTRLLQSLESQVRMNRKT